MAEHQRWPRIVAFAFACNPNRGSEAAAGWGCVTALTHGADVTALVHPQHLDDIEDHLRRDPNPRLRVVAVPTVPWGLWGARVPPLRRALWLARYQGWLGRAREVALQHHAAEPFDVAVHLTLGMYWLPTTVVDLGLPSVLGPVGGAVRSKRALWPFLGPLGVAAELAENALVKVPASLPATRRSWQRATVRVLETKGSLRRLPRGLRPGTLIVNRSILVQVPPPPPVRPRERFVVFSSPLQARKGPRLVLTALRHTAPDIRLLFIHHGPAEDGLRRLADRMGLAPRVEFRGKVPRDEMFDLMSRASACVYTGLREEGGAALAEAMGIGAPTIVLGWAGAQVLADHATDPSRTTVVPATTPAETVRGLTAAIDAACDHPSTATGSYLDQDAARDALVGAVLRAVESGAAADATPPGARV